MCYVRSQCATPLFFGRPATVNDCLFFLGSYPDTAEASNPLSGFHSSSRRGSSHQSQTGRLRKAMAKRFQPLMALTSKVRSTISCAEKCGETRAHTSSRTRASATAVSASAHSSAGRGAALRPAEKPDLSTLERSFTLRTGDGFVDNFGLSLLTRVAEAAPGIQLGFIPNLDCDSTALRDCMVDLETGVLGSSMGPEIRVKALFCDRFIGVVRSGHALCDAEITPSSFAAGRKIGLSRRGVLHGPVDEALATLGLPA